MRPALYVTIGIAIGVTFTAVAAPSEILAVRKPPKDGKALAVPAAEHPPAGCGPEAAGWMYTDVDMSGGGTSACVCAQSKDRTWRWAALATGGEGLAGARECE